MKFLRMLTPDVLDQTFNRGLYSKDPYIKARAYLEDNIQLAKKGSTTSLNCLWQAVKENRLTKEEYYIISAQYEDYNK